MVRLWTGEPGWESQVHGRLEHVRSGRAVTFHGPDELVRQLLALSLDGEPPADRMPARSRPATE